mgnify:FL=1|jgi:hypothetical protein|tara:strand:- start:436 stop:654 length:219 start_codon:yes stop_codon:yes gene_type:complete
MSKVKVEGYDNLTRDTRSNAIVNTSVTEYQLYMQRRESRKSQSDQIKSACREINNLKQELREIKSLIKEIIK